MLEKVCGEVSPLVILEINAMIWNLARPSRPTSSWVSYSLPFQVSQNPKCTTTPQVYSAMILFLDPSFQRQVFSMKTAHIISQSTDPMYEGFDKPKWWNCWNNLKYGLSLGLSYSSCSTTFHFSPSAYQWMQRVAAARELPLPISPCKWETSALACVWKWDMPWYYYPAQKWFSQCG